MAIVPIGSEHVPELDSGNCADVFEQLLDSQRSLFYSQISEFQRVVVTQCKLTGVNPLAQEMAAGALSIKIGKRSRDMLNPKATKYMSSVFSIKDTIGKKETREISALCGITVTQVREFFAGQRSRVKKFVRFSQEEEIRSDVSKGSPNVFISSSDQSLVGNSELSGSVADHSALVVFNQVPDNSAIVPALQDSQKISAIPNDVKPADAIPICALPEDTAPGIDSEDKQFLENIFSLMKKEETFTGRVKLMEWVLQIHNSAVLDWFLTKGGITILATWLSQAAFEEQTSVILVIFKVLCHMPLHKAMPAQMSVILQTVNRLRFYRTSDISNRARILLSRWSKLFIRKQLKKPLNSSSRDIQKQIVRKQRICEILSDESWQSRIDLPEDILALSESTEVDRKLEPKRMLKLLPAVAAESNGKQYSSILSSKTKHRRKVLLVEQPDHKIANRDGQVPRAAPLNHSRPMSADDIQKAKMRAVVLQNKYGKNAPSTSEQQMPKSAVPNVLPGQTIKVMRPSRLPSPPHLRKLHDANHTETSAPKTIASSSDATKLSDAKLTISSEDIMERFRRNEIRWRSPPDMQIDPQWRVAYGESSKEVEVQTARIRRVEETFYDNQRDIPPNPKDPWDVEMDFDDSLTPEIPTEQPPDTDVAEGTEGSSPSFDHLNDAAVVATPAVGTVAISPAAAPGAVGIHAAPGPDLELLAALLKNPELVFALTSGQGTDLTPEQTVAVLDAVKNNSSVLAGSSNGNAEPTSLPSPTPVSERHRHASAYANALELQAGSASAWPPAPALVFQAPPTMATILATTPHSEANIKPTTNPWRTSALGHASGEYAPAAPPHMVNPNVVLPTMANRCTVSGNQMDLFVQTQSHDPTTAATLRDLYSAMPSMMVRSHSGVSASAASASGVTTRQDTPADVWVTSWRNGLAEAPAAASCAPDDASGSAWHMYTNEQPSRVAFGMPGQGGVRGSMAAVAGLGMWDPVGHAESQRETTEATAGMKTSSCYPEQHSRPWNGGGGWHSDRSGGGSGNGQRLWNRHRVWRRS